MLRKYTISEIRNINIDAGHHYFDRGTMKAFGDTLKSFKVRHVGERVFIERVKESRNRPAGYSNVGDIMEFFPDSGRVGVRLYEEEIRKIFGE